MNDPMSPAVTVEVTAFRDRRSAGEGFQRGTPRTLSFDTPEDPRLAALRADPLLKVIDRPAKVLAGETGASSQTPPAKPETEAALDGAIRNALEALGPEGLTSTGKPSVRSVEKALGYSVTAEDIRRATAEPNRDGMIDEAPTHTEGA